MSKILMNVTLFHAKLFVNTYTALTLPFYAIYQKPWRLLKLNSACRVRVTLDKHGNKIYARNGPAYQDPMLQCRTFVEAIQNLDRTRIAVGIREILEERFNLDESGNPIEVDGRSLKKFVLADEYKWLTVGEIMQRVDNIARGLHEMGVRKGDKVIIYAETTPNWFFCSLAIAKLNAILVTLYSNLGDSGVRYGMNQTKANYVITTEDLKNKVLNYIDQVPHVKNIVYMSNKSDDEYPSTVMPPDHVQVKTLDELMESGAKLPHIQFELPQPEDVALTMYTSGTTSLPKAVIITHHTLMSNIKSMIVGAYDNRFDSANQLLASFLPLGHIFGFVFNIYMFINGSKLGFSTPFTLLNSSPSHVPGQIGDLKLMKPNCMIVVPLVLERFQKEIYAKLNKKSSLAAPLFTYFMDYKIRWLKRGFDTPIINKVICKKIKEEFGGELSWMGVGGAPLHHQIQSFTNAALDVKLLNAYGATETCAGVTSMSINDLSIGEVGTPFDGTMIKLANWPEGGYTTQDKPNPRGEVVVGGDTVTDGYFEMPEETKEAFEVDENGVKWFYTGDIGEIEPETGKLSIIDRKKDLAKLANGEYISLGKVESGLRSSRYVENICICTNMFSNNVVALISPNRKVLRELAKSINKGDLEISEICEDEVINDIVLDAIRQSGVRAELKSKEIPVRIKLTSYEWTPDNNLLTAAFKLKRKKVYEYYKEEIDSMFNSIKPQ